MKEKLHAYIDTIFADAERRAPHSRRLAELKEEMLQNLTDKYDDLIAAGKSPAAAYNMAIAGVGDVTDLLDSVVAADTKGETAEPAGTRMAQAPKTALSPEEEEERRRYRSRSAVLTSIAIALYILCVVPPMIAGDGIIGPVLMFVMIALATGLLIYNGMSKPKRAGATDDDDDDDDDDGNRDDKDADRSSGDRPRRSPVYGAVSGAIWILTVCAYLLVSFATGRWAITWMMFLIATALDNLIKAIFDLRR